MSEVMVTINSLIEVEVVKKSTPKLCIALFVVFFYTLMEEEL